MGLPKQVQEAGERADRLIEQMQNQNQPQEPAQPAPPAQPQEPAQPAPSAPQAAPKQEPATGEVQPGAPASPAPAPSKDERTDWKARYHVLKGKYDAEVPRMAQTIRELREELQKRDQEIASLKSSATPQPGNTASTPDETQFDPELLALIERRVEARVGEVTKPVVEEVASQRKSQQQLAWDRFLSDVEAEVPDYRTVDTDDGFQQWAGEIEPIAGKTRGELLEEAIAQLNSARVIAIYGQFKSQHKGASAPPAPPQGAVVAPPLEDRVTPAPNTASPPAPQPKIWSRAEVARFYTDVTRGNYKGREREAGQIEAEIAAAYAEGRVR